MKRVSTPLVLLMLVGPAAACGAAGGAATEEGSAASTAAAAVHPCEAFTLDDVGEMFGVAAEAVTGKRDPAPGTPTCAYTWERPDREAIDERNRAAMMRAFQSGSAGVPRFEATENELFITFHGVDYRSTADALEAFDRMVDDLTRGVSAGTDEASFEARASFESVDGIGARAAWSDELRQLSAVSGTRLFHVRLRTDEARGPDRAGAEAVARRIAAAL